MMEKNPKIAVIIPTVNRKEVLRHCLECLKSQTYKNFQIFVINNGSTDGTEKMLREDFPNVEVLNFKEMLGSAGGYKEGLEKAFQEGFEWFWLMDDDAWADQEALELLIQASHFDKSRVYASAGLDEAKTGLLSWTNYLLKDKKKFKVSSYSELGSKDLVESDGIGYIGLFLPRQVIEKVGYPNEKMFAWADDVDYFIRIRKAGYRMFFVRKSLVYHPKSNYHELKILWKKIQVTENSPWKEYYSLRNNIYVWLKYESRFKTLFFKLPKQILLYLILVLFYRDQKLLRFNYYFKAFFDALRGNLGIRVLPK